MRVLNLPKRVINYIKKKRFVKKFKHFPLSSGIGIIGYGDTCTIYNHQNITVGENTWLGKGTELSPIISQCGKTLHPCLKIGNNVSATSRLRIACAGNVTIGDNCLFGPEIFITDQNHGMDPTVRGGTCHKII